MQQTTYKQDHTFDLPVTRQVSLNAPVRWLKAGWSDFRRTPLASGFYGLMFVLLAYAVTLTSWQSPVLMLSLVGGFFLVTPFLAMGLYDLSRQVEQTEHVGFLSSLIAFKQNKADVGLLVVFHAIVMIAWIRLGTIIGALYIGSNGTSVSVLFEELWRSGEGLQMMAVFTVAGAVIAAAVFITSVISWPMILDRREGAIHAMATSVKVVMHNKLVMLTWAASIGLLFVVGIATFYLGLLIIIPILGHATWHAYKELVE